jgi:hypothetical protein
MTKLSPLLALTAILLGPLVAAAPAQAQLSRTFVSAASGNDANNCDRPTPCRTFQGAHDKTNDQGEITVLDSGGYGAVTITKSISIVNDGVGEASILVSGGATGIAITGGASTSVNLRGLTVQGIGFGGGNGLVFNGGLSLTVTKCVFRNLDGAAGFGTGVAFSPAVGGTHNLFISDSVVADNSNSGIIAFPTGTGQDIRIAVKRVQMLRNGVDGIAVGGGSTTGSINAAVSDSLSANNARFGFGAVSVANGATTSLMMLRSVSANNSTGVTAGIDPRARLWIGQSAISGNTLHTWFADGGTLQSFGDNAMVGNADGNPALPTIAMK